MDDQIAINYLDLRYSYSICVFTIIPNKFAVVNIVDYDYFSFNLCALGFALSSGSLDRSIVAFERLLGFSYRHSPPVKNKQLDPRRQRLVVQSRLG